MTDHEQLSEAELLKPPRAYWLVALLTGLITGVLAFIIGYSLYQHSRLQQDEQFAQQVQAYGRGISDFVHRSLGAVYTLGTLVQVSDGQIDDFQLLGDELSTYFPGASALALAKGGVISQVWPLAGNEGELQRDLLLDPERGADAMMALQNKSLTLSSPFYQTRGGRVMAGRLPVFVSDASGSERFWGFVVAIIDLTTIQSLPEIQALRDQQLRFRLWRLDPNTAQRDLLLPVADEGDLQRSHEVSLELANAHWILSVEQPPNVELLQRAFIMLLVGIITSLALGYSVIRFFRCSICAGSAGISPAWLRSAHALKWRRAMISPRSSTPYPICYSSWIPRDAITVSIPSALTC